METHVGIDTKSIKDQNIQFCAYLERKRSHIYLCLTDALQPLAWYLPGKKSDISRNRFVLFYIFFFLTSYCITFLQEETDCDSKHSSSKARKRECRWEVQGFSSSVWKEDFGCRNPPPPVASVKEALPAPRVWIGRK